MLPLPYKLLAGAILLLSAMGLGYQVGKKLEREGWLEKQAAMKDESLAVLHAAQASFQEKLKQYNQINVELSTKHENTVLKLRQELSLAKSDAAKRGGLRVPASICDQGAGSTKATGDQQHDAYLASTRELPAATQADLWSTAQRADELVEQARELQEWIKENGFYGEVK